MASARREASVPAVILLKGILAAWRRTRLVTKVIAVTPSNEVSDIDEGVLCSCSSLRSVSSTVACPSTSSTDASVASSLPPSSIFSCSEVDSILLGLSLVIFVFDVSTPSSSITSLVL